MSQIGLKKSFPNDTSNLMLRILMAEDLISAETEKEKKPMIFGRFEKNLHL